jgi:hypothetical protein
MKKYILILVCFMVTGAQGSYIYGDFSGESAVLQEMLLFQEPDTLSTVLCTVIPGTEIEILENTNLDYEKEKLITEWYKISCESDGIQYTGYSPSLYFACTSQTLSSGAKFLFGLTGYNPETYSVSGIARIVSNDGVVTETEVTPQQDYWGPGNRYGYTVDSRLQDVAGFSDLKDIVIIFFIYEACGYENRDLPVFWNGENLICAEYASSMAEAGIFHVNHELIFPSDQGGIDNTLVIHGSEEEWDEEAGGYVLINETEESYIWTGDGFQDE